LDELVVAILWRRQRGRWSCRRPCQRSRPLNVDCRVL